MTDKPTETKKSSINPIAAVGIGCLGVLVVLVGLSIIGILLFLTNWYSCNDTVLLRIFQGRFMFPVLIILQYQVAYL
jgi:hypothetical protein